MAKEFLKSRQVKYIYISIDKEADEMKWKKASKDDKITMDQYILMNGLKADLAQYLKVTSIPRYIILNKEHKLKSIDAPRPNFTQLDKLKGAIINATKN
jgi:alkyl hydroperoxide reductase subunit AhpC